MRHFQRAMMYLQKTKFRNIVIALLVGILMNPILLSIIIWVDSPTSNEMYQKSLLERTPFAYVYFWAGAFLPDKPIYFGMELLFCVIGNTILYAVLSYFALTLLGTDQNKLK